MSIHKKLITIFGKISDSEIYKSIKWSDYWKERLLIEREYDPTLTKAKAIRDWMTERWGELALGLKGAVEVNGQLAVHRCITVADPQSFARALSQGILPPGYEGLGIYWTWDYRFAECYWGEYGQGKKEITLTGSIDLDAINIRETVLALFEPSLGGAEQEIRVMEGEPILLTGVSLSSASPAWTFDPPVRMPA
jgi:hypothetical protein